MTGSFPFRHLKHLLVDLDGVLYRGSTPIKPAADFVSWLRDHRITIRLVTNNAALTPAQYVAKLGDMGIDVAPEEVFTSALATALYLQAEGHSADSVYVVGEDGLISALQEIGMTVTAERPHWVVAGLDRTLTYDKLATAALAIGRGAGFIGTNPDTSFPTERGLLPGAGAIQALLAAATGKEPLVIGKPRPLMLRLAMESLGGSVHDTAMLGDRLDTDIQGAEQIGMPSILVLTGVSTRAELARSPIHPTAVVDHLGQLMQLWSTSPA